MTWHRDGNFYKQIKSATKHGTPYITNTVTFYNIGSPNFKAVYCERTYKKEISFRIELSPINEKEIRQICSRAKFSSEAEITPEDNTITIYPQSVKCFMEFLKENWVEAYSPELETELIQIANYNTRTGLEGHIISEGIYSFVYTNPQLKQSTELVNVLEDNETKYHVKEKKDKDNQVKKLLAAGENPNQFNYNWTALYLAESTKNLVAIRLLLIYGGNPFQRTAQSCSAFEEALKVNHRESLDLYKCHFSNPERPLKPPLESKEKVQVRALGLSYQNDHLVTTIKFNNDQKIKTILKYPNQLLQSEKKNLYKLFKFFGVDKKTFEDEALSKQFLIELIINNDNGLIGFNIFEIVVPPEFKNHLILHCAYSLILPQFRGLGIMSLLTCRLAFSIQLLAPHLAVGIFCGAINYNSYRMAKDFLHYPKYQPDYMHKLVDHILEVIYNGPPNLKRNILTCFTTEKVTVKLPDSIPKDDLIQQFFYLEILGLPSISKENSRAAPILFYVEDQSFKKLSYLLSIIGINFYNHLKQLSPMIKPIFSKYTGVYQSVSKFFYRADHLFWNNKLKNGSSDEMHSATQLRSKL